jgi:UDP-perosamine 4-acetyltransferase
MANLQKPEPRRSASLVVFGAGGHAKVCLSICAELGVHVEIVVGRQGDPENLLGIRVTSQLNEIKSLPKLGVGSAFVAIGDNATRRRVTLEAEEMGFEIVSLISPRSMVDESVAIGAGSVVMPGAVVNIGSVVSRGVIVNSSASVDHDCSLGDFTHLGPNSTITGGCEIGGLSFIGAGSTLIPEVKIGQSAIVGAGSLVLADVADNKKVYGAPAGEK